MDNIHTREFIQIIRDYTDELATAVENGNESGAAIALSTIAQQVHMLRLIVPNSREYCADITHFNGKYIAPEARS